MFRKIPGEKSNRLLMGHGMSNDGVSKMYRKRTGKETSWATVIGRYKDIRKSKERDEIAYSTFT